MKSRLTTDEAKVLLVRHVADILERVAAEQPEERDEILAAIVLAVIEAGAYGSAEAEARSLINTLNKQSVEIARHYRAEPWLIVPAHKREVDDPSLDEACVRHGASGRTALLTE